MERAAQRPTPESTERRPRPIAGGIRLEYTGDLLQALTTAAYAIGQVRGSSRHVPHLTGVSRLFALWNGVWTLENEGSHHTPLEVLEDSLLETEAASPDLTALSRYVEIAAGGAAEETDSPLSLPFLSMLHRQCFRGISERAGSIRGDQSPVASLIPGRHGKQYTPPAGNDLQSLTGDFGVFLEESQDYPALIKAGILEAQWTLLQPFRRGNGLLSQLLLHRFLRMHHLLESPLCSLSRMWAKHRVEFAYRLQALLLEAEWNEWLQFYLRSLAETCLWSADVLASVAEMYRAHREKVRDLPGSTEMALSLLDYMYVQPLLNIQQCAGYLDVVFGTASSLLHNMQEQGIVREITGQRRNKRYLYLEYYTLFTGGAREKEQVISRTPDRNRRYER